MSHNTVLVVVREAEDPADAYAQVEDALAPFNEDLRVPHIEWLDEEKVEEAVAKAVEFDHHSPERPEKGTEAERKYLREAVSLWYADSKKDGRYDAETNRFGYFTTYNPRSRWDWYVLGGRWGGFFQVKKGVDEETVALGSPGSFGRPEGFQAAGRADLARKDAIDFDAMRLMATTEAEMSYDQFEEITKGMQVPPTFEEVRIKHGAGDVNAPTFEEGIGKAREEFGQYPWVQALRKADLAPLFGDIHDYWRVNTGGREAFIKRAHDAAIATFAILIDGEWVERGHMGWFGMSSDDLPGDEWYAKVAETLDGLPDDAWLAVVDVHI